ncbi:HupE / UreJ protein [Cognatiyoonia koreensis]|uniref:HupE / UreJ protein n=2 Tax=Cognatiyoonia koreensis TaxID=364200 RepID=A0A1I0P616_9RHOB|nr:HupE / UreJ protein [Cognatiyoonia koreensis]
MSTVLLVWITLVSTAAAHETLPAIADMTKEGDQLVFDIRLNVESLLSGIDLTSFTDTNDAPQAAVYDDLRAQDPAALEAAFTDFWPTMAENIDVLVDGTPVPLTLASVSVPEVGDVDNIRTSDLQFTAALPEGADTVSVGWASEYGVLVFRQMGVDAAYTDYLEAGASTPAFSLTGGDQASGLATFIEYIPVGFDHIVPKGLDHILFVLGLFFLSTRMRPLIWQISAFTLAHTITLALAALGWVNIPGSIVEPLIALSIVYVAVENIFTDGLSRWRPAVIFGFGLLHGLGFASVLAEFGLPENSFIPALIGFNIGVEIGQLAVIAVAFLCVTKAIDNSKGGDANIPMAVAYLVAMAAVFLLMIPLSGTGLLPDLIPLIAIVAILLGLSAVSASVPRFDGYREIVAMPGSVLIAVVAAYWCVERVFL